MRRYRSVCVSSKRRVQVRSETFSSGLLQAHCVSRPRTSVSCRYSASFTFTSCWAPWDFHAPALCRARHCAHHSARGNGSDPSRAGLNDGYIQSRPLRRTGAFQMIERLFVSAARPNLGGDAVPSGLALVDHDGASGPCARSRSGFASVQRHEGCADRMTSASIFPRRRAVGGFLRDLPPSRMWRSG